MQLMVGGAWVLRRRELVTALCLNDARCEEQGGIEEEN